MMPLLERPFHRSVIEVRWGLLFLLIVALLRFAAGPVLGIPFGQGTHFFSLTVALPLTMVLYSVRAGRQGRSYKDVLGLAAVLGLANWVLIVGLILLDETFSLRTYYTSREHIGNMDLMTHVAGHTVSSLVFTLILWGMGCLLVKSSQQASPRR